MADIDELEMELEAPNDNEWNDARFQRRMDTVATASANLGELLLKGWTMLAEECKTCHTPLMRLRDAPPKCVLCSPKTDELNSQSPSKPKEKDTINVVNDDEFQKRMKKSEDASEKIGELLLKGWTMLAQHCQTCQTPLMSLRGGKAMCCICDETRKSSKNTVKQTAKTAPTNTMSQRRNCIDVERKGNDDRDKYGDNGVPPRYQAPPHGHHGHHPPHYGHPSAHHGHPPHYGHNGHPPAHHGSYGHCGHPPPVCFGFGVKQDQQLRRTFGDIVKTVLDKMNAINERMSGNNNSLRDDIVELNQLMEFLQNVKKFKKQLMQ